FDFILKKRVNWIQDVPRIDLDPYFYRLFSTRQALNDVGRYADIIERTMGNFFILDEQAHLILDVKTQADIKAKDLFGLGSEILYLIDEFAKEYDVDVSSEHLEVSLTLNSPGKIDLKSYFKKTTVVCGLIVLIAGGGFESRGWSLKSEGGPGIIKAINDFLDKRQAREMKRELFDKYKDSLNVEDPDDLIKLWKQFSDNKDLPK
ncbi:MAG: hypothetical protein WCF67_09325, partial [Chitinophagaceae bacterium]